MGLAKKSRAWLSKLIGICFIPGEFVGTSIHDVVSLFDGFG